MSRFGGWTVCGLPHTARTAPGRTDALGFQESPIASAPGPARPPAARPPADCRSPCIEWPLQDKWEATEEKPAVIAISIAAFLAIWTANGVITAVDKIPVISDLLELEGILVTGWFVYRCVCRAHTGGSRTLRLLPLGPVCLPAPLRPSSGS